MEVNILGNSHSLINHYLAEMRDINMQHDRMRFRRNLERFGEIMAYEISRQMPYIKKEIKTPLGSIKVHVLKKQPVIATILRAGLPLHHGLLNYFDMADNAFVSAYRKHTDDKDFNIKIEYLSSPSINNRIVVLSDPMLATGQSMLLSFKALLKKGTPEHTHIVSVIGSAEGVDYVNKNFPANTTLWIGTVDKKLNALKYIVPGLGDAGDLAFGGKE